MEEINNKAAAVSFVTAKERKERVQCDSGLMIEAVWSSEADWTRNLSQAHLHVIILYTGFPLWFFGFVSYHVSDPC
jgi:hypothetical protein